MADPADALRDLVVGDSSFGFTTGEDAFVGKMRPVSDHVPVRAIFFNAMAGSSPVRVMGESKEVRAVPVEIILRWNDYSGGREKAQSMMDGLMGETPVDYLDMFTTQSGPTHAGPTQEGHHIFYVLYMLRYEHG